MLVEVQPLIRLNKKPQYLVWKLPWVQCQVSNHPINWQQLISGHVTGPARVCELENQHVSQIAKKRNHPKKGLFKTHSCVTFVTGSKVRHLAKSASERPSKSTYSVESDLADHFLLIYRWVQVRYMVMPCRSHSWMCILFRSIQYLVDNGNDHQDPHIYICVYGSRSKAPCKGF